MTLNLPEDLHPESKQLVVDFAEALAEKMLKAEQKYGYTDNWMRPDWGNECRTELMRHVHKGDPKDVAIYCAFLWHHNEPTIVREPSTIRVNIGTNLINTADSLEDLVDTIWTGFRYIDGRLDRENSAKVFKDCQIGVDVRLQKITLEVGLQFTHRQYIIIKSFCKEYNLLIQDVIIMSLIQGALIKGDL